MTTTSTRRPYKRCDVCGIGERKAYVTTTTMRYEGGRIYVSRRCEAHPVQAEEVTR